MIAADGTWLLNIQVTDLQTDLSVRVKGDQHIGGVMLKLVESLDVSRDWSDHSLYWPDKTLWLSRARSTLDHYGVNANSKLVFTPMHKIIKIQLPDLRTPQFRINFSVNVFSVNIKLCKELGIRHPEELSLMRKLEPEELKKNHGVSGKRSERLPTGIIQKFGSNDALNEARTPSSSGFLTPDGTLARGYNPYATNQSPSRSFNANGMFTPGSMDNLDFHNSSALSHENSSLVLPNFLPKVKNLSESARVNVGWLNSSLSLMEQGVKESDILLLRHKFFDFYDLNPKYDSNRIRYIYEQAKWSILTEELICSDEEMVMMAALQVQVEEELKKPESHYDNANASNSMLKDGAIGNDEIDSDLFELQMALEGSGGGGGGGGSGGRKGGGSGGCDGSSNGGGGCGGGGGGGVGSFQKIPRLKDCMRCYRPRKFHLKTFVKYLFTLSGEKLSIYKCDDGGGDGGGGGGGGGVEVGEPLKVFNLSTSESFILSSAFNVKEDKYIVKLLLPFSSGVDELWIRQDNEEQFVKWLTALRLIHQGKSLTDLTAFDSEKRSVTSLIKIQKSPTTTTVTSTTTDLQINDLTPDRILPPRFTGKVKNCKQMLMKVLEVCQNVRHMDPVEAQLNYIKIWQMVPHYGFKYFIIRLKDSKKEELLGIGTDRLIRMDLKKGDILKTWMYKTIQTWSVNWDIKQMHVSFEHDDELIFQCLTADCKVVHEYLGGYIFLSMRSADKNQALDEELFHKLTGGWV